MLIQASQRVVAAVATLFCVAPGLAQDAGVSWSQGRLSIAARNQSTAEVLREIQSRTGIVIRSDDPLNDPVVRGFERLPLAEGLRQLLVQHNHMIVDGRGRQPLLVFVLGAGGTRWPQPAMRSGVAASSGATAIAAHRAALASTDPAARIEAVEQLADSGDAASLAAIRQALTDPAEAVRVVAQQALAAREKTFHARGLQRLR